LFAMPPHPMIPALIFISVSPLITIAEFFQNASKRLHLCYKSV